MALQTTTPFDPLFARHAGPIPQGYLRALAYKESGFRPDIVHPRSRATGLFQITTPALTSFNQRAGTALSLEHLVNPEVNTKVAVQHLVTVMDVYRRYRSLQPDWSSRRWIELLTLGWNAGHNALARIAEKMEASGIPPERITVDTVSQVAAGLGAAKYVADPARVAWAKSVADLFLGGGGSMPRGTPRGLYASMVPGIGDDGGGGGGKLVLLGLAGFGLVARIVSRSERKEAR